MSVHCRMLATMHLQNLLTLEQPTECIDLLLQPVSYKTPVEHAPKPTETQLYRPKDTYCPSRFSFNLTLPTPPTGL